MSILHELGLLPLELTIDYSVKFGLCRRLFVAVDCEEMLDLRLRLRKDEGFVVLGRVWIEEAVERFVSSPVTLIAMKDSYCPRFSYKLLTTRIDFFLFIVVLTLC